MARKKAEEVEEKVQEEVVEDNSNLDDDTPDLPEEVEAAEGVKEAADRVIWQIINLDHYRYLLNSLGEVYKIEPKGFVDHEVTFARTITGQWQNLKGYGIRGHRRLTPRMVRDLENNWRRLIQRLLQIDA